MTYSATVLGVPWYDVLWFFFIFCVLGVLVEMIFCFAKEGVIESRVGLLYLPLSPIYGFGAVALSLFLKRWVHEPVLMFLLGIVVGTVLEYIASFVMEKAFSTVFWDYSDKPLNLHGRVCLEYSIYWGLLSLLLLDVLDRWALAFVGLVDPSIGGLLLTVLLVSTIASTVLTLAAFKRTERRVARLSAAGSATPSPERDWERVVGRLVPDHVLINTFPRMNLVMTYCELTGQQRRWIRVNLHLGRPSPLHLAMRDATTSD